MDYKLKNLKINEETISYYEKDNKAKYTILFIHGYNSSSDFAKEIFNLKQNFNILAINLPGSKYLKKPNKKLTIGFFNEIVEVFINKHIKAKNIIILGHSLGGATAAHFNNHLKIKKIIFISSVHPKIVKSESWLKLKDFYLNSKSKKLNEYLRKNIELKEIFDKNTLYAHLTKKYLLNKNYITKKLCEQYKNSLIKKPLFIIGEKDYIIETKFFIQFVTNTLKQSPIILKGIGHNPLKEAPILMNKLLNENIQFKKRWWPRKLTK